MNKWKIAFWICLIALIITNTCASYLIIDQAYSITYSSDSYNALHNDLETLIKISQQDTLTKAHISKLITDHRAYDMYNTQILQSDTITLSNVRLIFHNDTLQHIIKH